MKLYPLFILLSLWIIPQSFGTDIPRYKMPYSEFEALVKKQVENSTELKPLWENQKNEHKNVYLGGGDLRNILRNLDKKILDAEASGKAVEVNPNYSLIAEGKKTADHDLWIGDPKVSSEVKSLFPDWDLLDQGFYEASVKAGGATIEKIRVNTGRIEDPYGALKAWYNGKLDFHLSTTEALKQTSDRLLYENTFTVMALRFLRFSIENPEWKVAPETWAKIRKIAESEKILPKENWFVHKGLANLWLSSGSDFLTFYRTLKESGLLENLRANGYHLEDIGKWKDSRLFTYEHVNPVTSVILNSDLSHEDQIAAIRFIEPDQPFPRLMYFTEFTFPDGDEISLSEFRKFAKGAKSLDEIAELLNFQDLASYKQFSGIYFDVRKRLSALFTRVPELSSLIIQNEQMRNHLLTLFKDMDYDYSEWVAFRPQNKSIVKNCKVTLGKIGTEKKPKPKNSKKNQKT